ncbi:MAG TPA: hypothetical protein VGB00_16465 [Pyrinomonadaceae bacterium]|jgi:hypothetical protein
MSGSKNLIRGSTNRIYSSPNQDSIKGEFTSRAEDHSIIIDKNSKRFHTFLHFPECFFSVTTIFHISYPEILRDYHRLRSMENDEVEMEYVEEIRQKLAVKDWLNGFDSIEERRERDRDRENNSINIYGSQNIVNHDVTDALIANRQDLRRSFADKLRMSKL